NRFLIAAKRKVLSKNSAQPQQPGPGVGIAPQNGDLLPAPAPLQGRVGIHAPDQHAVFGGPLALGVLAAAVQILPARAVQRMAQGALTAGVVGLLKDLSPGIAGREIAGGLNGLPSQLLPEPVIALAHA